MQLADVASVCFRIDAGARPTFVGLDVHSTTIGLLCRPDGQVARHVGELAVVVNVGVNFDWSFCGHCAAKWVD